MKKIFTLFFAVSLGFTGLLKAQQDPQFTQFMYVKQAYNPAFVGTDGAICFNALYRQQWVSFPGAPKTGVFGFNMPIDVLGGMGVGLYFANDQLGAMASNAVRVAAAKHFVIGENGALLSAGLDAGIFQQRINGTFIAPQTLNDPAIPSNPSNNSSNPGTNAPGLNKIVPDIGFGLYFTMPNKMYVGVSTTHLPASTLQGNQHSSGGLIGTPTQVNAGYNLTFDVARHYYIVAGYTFSFQGGDHNIIPNLKVKTDAATTQVDMNLTYMLQKKFWIGATYRLQDAVAPMIGFQFPFGLKVGYSYDVTLSKIKGYSSGTHEVMLGYCFKPKDKPKAQSHWNVRYFED
ncbi:MAG TPA: type IX secretion system membrane protein PorP/SprF [Bacteroidia bacterium]|nr:type IX secretion system membrane protein PorP/SprF [Bacteroidia bacterium]